MYEYVCQSGKVVTVQNIMKDGTEVDDLSTYEMDMAEFPPLAAKIIRDLMLSNPSQE